MSSRTEGKTSAKAGKIAAENKKTITAAKPKADTSATSSKAPASAAKANLAKAAPPAKAGSAKMDSNGARTAAKSGSRLEDNRASAAVTQAVLTAPPSNGKPRKNQAGFSPRELESLRDLLLAKRRELIGDMSSMEREALRSSTGSNLSNLPIHMADMGTDNYEQEFTLGLVQKDRDLLKEINLALAKIQNGTYGICEGTGEPIIKERLEFQPWVRYSVEYQRKMERHGR